MTNKGGGIQFPEMPTPQKLKKAPNFAPSSISYGGQQVASMNKTYTTNKKGKKKFSGYELAYNPTEEEKQRQSMQQERINALLPSLGQSDPAINDRINQITGAYSDNAKAQFDRMYNPAMRKMRDQMGSRFGTLKATPYMDKVQEMEQQIRVPAYMEIANNAASMGQNLLDQDQGRKLQELQALGYQLNSDQQSFLNMLNPAQSAAQFGNQYLMNKYQLGNQFTQNQNAFDLQRYQQLANQALQSYQLKPQGGFLSGLLSAF